MKALLIVSAMRPASNCGRRDGFRSSPGSPSVPAAASPVVVRSGRASGRHTGGIRLRGIGRNSRARVVGKGDRPVRAALHLAQTGQRAHQTVLDGVAHLEDEAVDLAGGLQLVESTGAKQPAQHAVIAFEQFGKRAPHGRAP